MSGVKLSIITVNYNGKRLLGPFLDSIFKIDYPKSLYEVIVVDNGSSDGSVKYIRKKFPQVNLVLSKKNLGFGGGNNLGIKNSKGELVYLLNNDTKLSKNAIRSSVKCFEEWSKKEKVGAITSKLIFYDSYLHLKLYGAVLADYSLSQETRAINKRPIIRNFPLPKSSFQDVLIPFNHLVTKGLSINLVLSKINMKKFKVITSGELIVEGEFGRSKNHKSIKIDFSKAELKNDRCDLFQNAGNFYFRDGYGRDRGVFVVQSQQYYEIDNGQYDKDEHVPGFNGAAVLLNKKMLQDVGLFDENFFMYYEDGELSIRMKKSGWNTVYCPKSVVRHIHSASSKEFSDFFIYHTERNRLLLVIKHWPLSIVSMQIVKYLFESWLGSSMYYVYKGEVKLGIKRFLVRSRVVLSIVTQFLCGLIITDRLSSSDIKYFL